MAQRKNTQAPSQARFKRIAKEIQFVRDLVITLEPVCKTAPSRAAWETSVDNLQSIGRAFEQFGVTDPARKMRKPSEYELTRSNCGKPFEIVRRSESFMSGWRQLCNWLRKFAPTLASELAQLDVVELLRGRDELHKKLDSVIHAAPIPRGVKSLFLGVGRSSSQVILTLVGASRFYPNDPDRFVRPTYQPPGGEFSVQCLRALAAIGKRLPESQEFIDYALVPAVAGLLACEAIPKLAPRKRIVIGHFSGDVFEITPRTAKRA